MAYTLQTSYMGESLLNGFDWVNGTDLSNGYVSYQGQEDAEAQGLFSLDEESGVVRLGVDSSNTYQLDEGRPSVRLESKESWTHGLFIADFLHMPPSQCGLWPAFWAYGDEWPTGGELDIIEGANTAHNNIISAHTAPGCFQDSSSQEGLFTGEQRNEDCYVGDQNIGCGYNPPSTDASSYGDGFNAVGGGVYAMEWDSDFIKVWHFARGEIPADIGDKAPNPKTWGKPQAVFGSERCDVDDYFKDMSLVININFCGDYGNALWGNADSCTDFAPTCQEYVANNPEAFANAYWDVSYIDAYTFDSDATPSTPTTTPITTPTSTPSTSEAPTNPARIEDFSYLGCFSSSSSFDTFKPVQESGEMTLEMCIESCSDQTYAGLRGNNCLCASTLDETTMALPFESSDCSQPCPGDASQFCGGEARLTVYANVQEEEQPQPPPMAGRPQERFAVGTTTVCPSGVAQATGGPVMNGTQVIPEAGAVEKKGPGRGIVVVWAVVVGLVMVM